MTTGDKIACEGGGVRREGGKGKPAERFLSNKRGRVKRPMRGKIDVKGLRPLPTGLWGTGSSCHGCNPRETVRVRRPREGDERGGWAEKQPGAPPVYEGPGSGRREVIGPQRPGQGDPAAAPSLGSRYPPAPGGRGLQPLPTLPPRPARTPRPLRCPFAGQVPDTHVSRGSSGSSPARCSPTHSRPKERSGIRVARGPAGRNTWGLRARNRKRPLAPPPGRAGASLGSGRFGRLVVGARCVVWVEAWGSREPGAGKVCPGPLPPGPVPFATNQSTPWVWDSLPTSYRVLFSSFMLVLVPTTPRENPPPSHAVVFSHKRKE